jgi:hypothetical protein
MTFKMKLSLLLLMVYIIAPATSITTQASVRWIRLQNKIQKKIPMEGKTR